MKNIKDEDEIFQLAYDCYNEDAYDTDQKLKCEGYEYIKDIRDSLLQDLKPWIILFAKKYRYEVLTATNASVDYDLF